KKLLGQVLIALGVWFGGVGIDLASIGVTGDSMELGWASAVLTVCWLVGLTNLVNLIDGLDGLAGGIALALMVALGGIGFGVDGDNLAAIGMSGAVLGFLGFNFP